MSQIRQPRLVILALAAALLFPLSVPSARAEVQVNVTGYLPAPPGMVIHVAAGRPYYLEHDRRVYLVKEHRGHGRKKHRDREEHGRHSGQQKHAGHGH